MNVEIKENDQTIKGFWNGKTYSSKKNDHRIYVDNKEYHVSVEAIESVKKIVAKTFTGKAGKVEIAGNTGYWNGKTYSADSGNIRVYLDSNKLVFTVAEFEAKKYVENEVKISSKKTTVKRIAGVHYPCPKCGSYCYGDCEAS